MRVVVEGISGEDLVLLIYILKRLNFDNKAELMDMWEQSISE